MSEVRRLHAIVTRPELGVAVLVLLACAYFYQAGGWNQNVRVDLVRAIVEDGSSTIDRFAKNTGDLSRRDGHFYCDKAPGASWLAVPAYAAVHAAAGSDRPTVGYLAWSAWLMTVFAVGIPSAIAAVMLARLLIAWGIRAGPACAAAAAWALATLALPYGTLLYGHQTAAALLLIGFAMLAIPRARGEVPSALRLVGAGVVLGYAVAVEYPAALACVVIGIYAIVAFGWRRAALIAAGAVPPAVALAAYHWIVFGGATALPYDFSTQGNRSQGWFMGIGKVRLDALWHILVSDYRGLLWSTPWLALAVPGGIALARRGRVAEVLVCVVITYQIIWLNASLVDWQGGWAMGARYLVPCLPFVVLLAAGVLFTRRLAILFVCGVLVAHGAFNMVVGTAVKPEVPVVIRQPYQDYLYPRFFRGELSVSTQGIHQIGPAKKGPRQAWNLGEKLGLSGLPSLAPLGVLAIACAAWITWRARAVDTDATAR
jgi:hypothetical protein